MYLRHLIPGIAISARTPAAPEALPRMDVALFVGFAAKGPVHRAVVIESPGAFVAVFGGDLVLTADCGAALGPAVRAFFANGGTRCHVVRTCRSPVLEQAWSLSRPWSDEGVAEASTFALPGVVALTLDGLRVPAAVRAASLGSWADDLRVSARLERTAIPLRGPVAAADGMLLGPATSVFPGELVEMRWGETLRGYGIVRGRSEGLFVEAVEGLPAADSPDRIDRLRLQIGVGEGRAFAAIGTFGLTPDAPSPWWAVLDDDSYYADQGSQPTTRGPLAPTEEPRPAAWLPLGLTEEWSASVGPDHSGATALERDGLSRFDAELFLDPRLADSRGDSLVIQAQMVREGDDDRLFGIHAALALPGGSDFAEPSLIVVPDLAQPGWIETVPEAMAPPKPRPFPAPASWRDHAGLCVPADGPPLLAPDAGHFLDCGTRLLPPPKFDAVEVVAPGPVTLSWSASEDDAVYVLMESARADFGGAVEIWRGTDREYTALLPVAGTYYFAVHAEHAGNVSAAGVIGVQAVASAWVSDAAHYRDDALVSVQCALLRLCAALGDQFAVLSLPRHYGADRAAGHRARLAAGLVSDLAPLRFGAVYHPWLIGADGPAGKLVQSPADGGAAGVIARRSRERGAWIGPARVPLADVVALADPIAPADRERLAAALVNAVAQEPHGFVMTDAMTLSDESDWREINVRRLVSLLRRTATRRGATYVFEPNGDVLRRVIERSFGHMLDDLQRRGAFAGGTARDSWRLMVDDAGSDRMNGKLVIEIAVCPSRPLRFLTVVLSQVGERLAVVEER